MPYIVDDKDGEIIIIIIVQTRIEFFIILVGNEKLAIYY